MAEPPEEHRFTPPPSGGDIDEPVAFPQVQPAEQSIPTGPTAAILDRHGAELLSIDGVEGYGIGTTYTGQEAIVMYLSQDPAAADLPTELEGVAVVPVVTESITATSYTADRA